MKVKNLKPNIQIAEYVERLLVIENAQSNDSFSLPLFANGSPTLLFISPKAIMGNKATSHLTLFGQTLVPDTLTFAGGFILIAYFFKPYSLNAIFGVMAPELTDTPIDLCLAVPKKTATSRNTIAECRINKTDARAIRSIYCRFDYRGQTRLSGYSICCQ